MSYDINIINKNTEETMYLHQPQFIRSGTVPAELNPATGRLEQSQQREASINITYNYSHYYYEATEGDERFAHDGIPGTTEYGIRGLYGKNMRESINMLCDMIERIKDKYQDEEGTWLVSKRTRTIYFDKDGNEEKNYISAILRGEECTSKEEKYEVSEGDTDNYWEATAANAIMSLQNMVLMATDMLTEKDAVWNGD